MSNSDRIAHMQAEADAARKEREAAAAARQSKAPAAKKAAAAPPAGRTVMVWAVCDHKGASVETFPYPKEQEARAMAERLTGETGKTHFVKRTEIAAD